MEEQAAMLLDPIYPQSYPLAQAVPARWFQVLLVLALLVAITVLPTYSRLPPRTISYILVNCQLIFVFFFFFVDLFVKQDHEQLFVMGQIHYFRSLETVLRAPMLILLAVTTAVFLGVLMQQWYCLDSPYCPFILPRHYLNVALLGLEVLVMLPTLSFYLYYCLRTQPQQFSRPEVQMDLVISSLQNSPERPDVMKMLELEADAIEYLEKQKTRLGAMLVMLAQRRQAQAVV